VDEQEPRPDTPVVPEDLERLRDSIATARRERERKEREFDQFVKAFREAPPPAPRPQPTRRVPPALVEPPPGAYRRGRASHRGRAAGVAAVAALLLLAWAWWPGSEVEAPDSSGTPVPAAEPAPAPEAGSPAPPVQAPAAPAEPAAALTVEIATDRPVWMRVTVDDARLFERLVPAGEKIPLRADRRIIVRAGDAGGVRLTVNGRDGGVLGGDGQVVTRTFTPPAAPR
jgi:hypothetical protein